MGAFAVVAVLPMLVSAVVVVSAATCVCAAAIVVIVAVAGAATTDVAFVAAVALRSIDTVMATKLVELAWRSLQCHRARHRLVCAGS